MSQWVRNSPFPLIQGAFLLVLVYYLYFCFSWIFGIIVFGFFLLLFRNYGWKVGGVVSLLLLLFIAFLTLRTSIDRKQEDRSGEAVQTIRLLPDTIQVNGDQLQAQARSDDQLYQVFYRLTSPDEQAFFQNLTDVVQLDVAASLSLPTEQRNFNGFSYRDYLRNKGIYQIVTIDQIKDIRKVSGSFWTDPLGEIRLWRRKALVFIQQHFPSPMKHYMTGLLFGFLDRDFDQMSDLYTSLGIIHLFALSGMQVSFFVGLFRSILYRLGLSKELVWKLQFPLSLIYAGLTGFSVSVTRALIQSLIGSRGLGKTEQFSLSLLICLLLDYRILLTVGGILTFSFAFLLSVLDWSQVGDSWRKAVEILAIPLGSLPILLYFFSGFQPLSIVLTLVFSFLFDYLILPGLLLIFLLSPVVNISWVNPFFQAMETVIVWVAQLFPRPWIFGKPSLMLLFLCLLGLTLLYDAYQKRGVRVLALGMIALALWFTKHPLENEITVVDIGQGDSILLRDRGDHVVMIDTGGKVGFEKEAWQEGSTTSNAERTLIPYLYSRGIDHIDQLVLTHTDADHVGDLLEVAKAVEVKEIWISQGSLTQESFVQQLRQLSTSIHVVKEGEELPIFDSSLQVLAPSGVGDGKNNDSIVLYGKLLGVRFLFTGDLEAEGEKDLLSRYPDLRFDILKAGHHGSKGSSSETFLDRIDAKIALVSAGVNNRYQHPNEETLDRFSDRNIQVYRTDQQGAIRFRGWDQWQIETVR